MPCHVIPIVPLVLAIVMGAPSLAQQDVEQSVSAQELIDDARAHEQWIHDVDGLILRLEGGWTRTPEAIARQAANHRRQFPRMMKIDAERFADLQPHTPQTLTIAFDDGRLFHELQDTGLRYERQFWDGQRSIIVNGPDEKEHDSYVFGTQPRSRDSRWNEMFVHLSWPRTTFHSYWWSQADPTLAEYERHGDATAVIAGKADFHGVECYILDMRGGFTRWYVGVEDHLLHGFVQRVQSPDANPLGAMDIIAARRGLAFDTFRQYADWKATLSIKEQIAVDAEYHRELIDTSRPMVEHFLLDYEEIAPGCLFPKKQGYSLFAKTPDERGQYLIETTRDFHLVEASVNQPLPDEWFEIELLRGVQVFDQRSGIQIQYRYDPDRTAEQIEAMVAQRREQLGIWDDEKAAHDAQIGQPAFAFPEDCQWMNGGPLTLEDLRGKVVILDFWAVW